MTNKDQDINNHFIGITDDRLHHIIGVARKCYKISKGLNKPEDFCRRMFMIGWNHDVGYEFSHNKIEHPNISKSLLKLINVNDSNEANIVLDAINTHGELNETQTLEWQILNIADMTIDSKGNDVDVQTRLEDIGNRYGKESSDYLKAYNLCLHMGLINN